MRNSNFFLSFWGTKNEDTDDRSSFAVREQREYEEKGVWRQKQSPDRSILLNDALSSLFQVHLFFIFPLPNTTPFARPYIQYFASYFSFHSNP